MLENEDKIVCVKCEQQWPATDYSMYEKDMEPTCDSCCLINQYHALWHHNKDEALKLCKLCQESKPLSDYYDLTGSKDGKHYECKACMRAKALLKKKALKHKKELQTNTA